VAQAEPAKPTKVEAPVVTSLPPPPPAAPVVEAKPDVPDPVVVVEPKVEPPKPSPAKTSSPKSNDHVVHIEDSPKVKKPDPAPPPDKKPIGKEPKKGDPNFDELLKEAGVQDQKSDDKPKLAKKALDAGDINKGMSSVAGKAQACFKGTDGKATVRLTVAPSGQVTKVSVGGDFAGKPEADCVAAVVRGITFPAWDGGPQSFGYSYLLSQ
jgi:hypothetical protein